MKLPWQKSSKHPQQQINSNKPHDSPANKAGNFFSRLVVYFLLTLLIVFCIIGIYWSGEPKVFDIEQLVESSLETQTPKVGYATVLTTEKVARTLLEKPGGYLSNDITPPSIFLDNIPSWEFGVLVQVRDMANALRNNFSRSQSQSLENQYLKQAEPLFNNDHASWIWPSAEGKYSKAIEQLTLYRNVLMEENNANNQFFARADNLAAWLSLVEKRLGDLSQKLSVSVGKERINTDLAGDAAASQSTQGKQNMQLKTPWMQIDNVFYEARGACWALIHLLKAAQIDFAPVLDKKNAHASLAQIIRELEATQEAVWSPMILNGSGFGLLANHSLVMASYISRANAGVIDLRELLANG